LSASDADYYRLRTEWLRYKSQLYDNLTGLPALPAVVDLVRRAIESRGSVDLVYLDLGRSGWHEAKLGWAAYDDGVKEFAGVLASLRQTAEIGPEDIVCLHTVRSDRFLVFTQSTGDGRNGHGAGARERLMRAVRQRVGDPSASALLRSLRISAGYGRVTEEPMMRAERAIQQAVTEAMLMTLSERESAEAARRDDLHRLIVQQGVRTVFHPIVRMRDGEPVGHEALTRPTRPTSFDSVEDMFAFAEGTEYLVEFERLCRNTAIQSAARVPRRGLLFLNASPGAVQDPEWGSGEVERRLRAAGIPTDQVVVEITERVAVGRSESFQAALKSFKARGFRVAVDDMGAGYASLQTLAAIEPDFLKFDTSLVRDIDKSSIKRSLLDSLRILADKIRARVIAEGVERDEERQTLLDLGIELGQGFHFHREPPHEFIAETTERSHEQA
jgi:EAL domain-containing protein (putative c-di-GMP-specific phosphodiesterase class I)